MGADVIRAIRQDPGGFLLLLFIVSCLALLPGCGTDTPWWLNCNQTGPIWQLGPDDCL